MYVHVNKTRSYQLVEVGVGVGGGVWCRRAAAKPSGCGFFRLESSRRLQVAIEWQGGHDRPYQEKCLPAFARALCSGMFLGVRLAIPSLRQRHVGSLLKMHTSPFPAWAEQGL